MTTLARRGVIAVKVSLAAGGIALVGFLVMQLASASDLLPDLFGGETFPEVITSEAAVAPFEHRVLERGEIGSSSNIELRCQVRSRNSSGVNILEIVPEGSRVEKGDFLVRLDDSALQTELLQQQIVCSNSEAAVIEAEAALEAADLALQEYKEGAFRELEEQQESAVFVSRENLRRAQEYLKYSKRLAERGYIPEAQLDADEFAVDKAEKELGVAQTKLNVLQQFTRKKMLTQLDADIKTAKAKLNSRRKTSDLDSKRLEEIREQIKRCTIEAPAPGQVVYANDQDRRGSSGDLLIAEGRPVRERQVIIRLPDPHQMRVIAKVHESRVSRVQPEMPVDVVLEAAPDQKLRGKVQSVSEYPLPSISVYMAHIKEYEVAIEILDPPPGLRPGMTAEVSILVESRSEALQVPLQAVIEREGKSFCAVLKGEEMLETREVRIGSANEESVILQSGVQAGEEVVLNIKDEEVLKRLDLPEEVSETAAETKDNDG